MGRWTVRDNGGVQGELFVTESFSDGRVSLHIPSPDPVVVTVETAEHIRLIIGSAIGDARSGHVR